VNSRGKSRYLLSKPEMGCRSQAAGCHFEKIILQGYSAWQMLFSPACEAVRAIASFGMS